MRRLTTYWMLVATGLSMGCAKEMSLERFVPPGADARARNYLALLSAHRASEAESNLLPALRDEQGHRGIMQLDSLIGGQQVDTMHLVGVSVRSFSGARHIDLQYEAHSQAGWFLENVATIDTGTAWFVEGVRADKIPAPLEQLNAFKLVRPSPRHLAWLLMCVGCAAFSLGMALWIATRGAMPKRWRWALFSLVGVGAFHLNWTTGQTASQLLNVQFGSAAFLRSGPYAPWVLTFAIPVGAMLALSHYRKWRADIEGAGPRWRPQ